jgi:hypothetical protein
MKDFGIIVACYQKDYRFAKGCCASIRYFLGDVPKGDDASIIHWAGGINSPLLARTEVYNQPMTFFRQKCLDDYAGINGIRAAISLQAEDFLPNLTVYRQKLKKQFPASHPLRKTINKFKRILQY